MKRSVLWCAVLATACVVLPSAQAGSVAGTGGSTEITQLLNNAQLVGVYAKQAQAVLTQLKQYQAQLTDLTHMGPASIVAGVLGYQDQLAIVQEMIAAVGDLKDASREVGDMYERRIGEMKNLKMNPADYLAFEAAIARRKGAQYRQQFERDTAAVETLRRRASSLDAMRSKALEIEGSVEGMRQLVTTNTIVAGEMLSLHQRIAEESARQSDEKLRTEESERKMSIAEREKRDRERAEAIGSLGTSITVPVPATAPASRAQ